MHCLRRQRAVKSSIINLHCDLSGPKTVWGEVVFHWMNSMGWWVGRMFAGEWELWERGEFVGVLARWEVGNPGSGKSGKCGNCGKGGATGAMKSPGGSLAFPVGQRVRLVEAASWSILSCLAEAGGKGRGKELARGQLGKFSMRVRGPISGKRTVSADLPRPRRHSASANERAFCPLMRIKVSFKFHLSTIFVFYVALELLRWGLPRFAKK
jgi:hypothetical protein